MEKHIDSCGFHVIFCGGDQSVSVIAKPVPKKCGLPPGRFLMRWNGFRMDLGLQKKLKPLEICIFGFSVAAFEDGHVWMSYPSQMALQGPGSAGGMY